MTNLRRSIARFLRNFCSPKFKDMCTRLILVSVTAYDVKYCGRLRKVRHLIFIERYEDNLRLSGLDRLSVSQQHDVCTWLGAKCQGDALLDDIIVQYLVIIRSSTFYHATRMHGADYAVARCPSLCPSVRPSHASILSKPLKVPQNNFLPSGSPTILVILHTKRDGNTPTGTPV